MKTSDLIEDAVANYSEWENVPQEEKMRVYITQAREDKELWESMFNHDEQFEFHGEKLMADMLEFGLLKDYAKFRNVFFTNLESYYHDSINNVFEKIREKYVSTGYTRYEN